MALYEAAVELFSARDYDSVSVDEICVKAGVGRATFFRLFGSKAGLVEEFNRRLAVTIQDRVAGARASSLKALQIIIDVIREAWMSNTPFLKRMVQEYLRQLESPYDTRSSASADANQQGGRALVEIAVRHIMQGQAKGEVARDLDADFLGLCFMNQLGVAIASWITEGGDDLDQLRAKIDQVSRVMLRGMTP
ncbi:TetR/AcrR family transcriptional regulator [Zavarzinia sp. CC-PAN008]|uniref:TetR/AcrR family transcriptional regulator n=1 Tax=Zavarzinia sp. CC-PAN008 TaxID=3243332 RepID=UPI003F74A379